MSNAKPARELTKGDVILYPSWRGGTIRLTVTSGPMPSKGEPHRVFVFTDNIGVLSAVHFGETEMVDVA